jgi:hypothetical protein
MQAAEPAPQCGGTTRVAADGSGKKAAKKSDKADKADRK